MLLAHHKRRGLSLAVAVCGLGLGVSEARAQTWIEGRTTPGLGEIVAIDRTGEDGWLFGFEDLAGDGTDFKQQEQSIDIRTAYATTDAARFWARTYVSDPNAAGGNVTVFVFIDSDDDPATGGSAAAAEIDARFVDDPTPGGFDFVIEVGGNATINEIWGWNDAMMQFQGTGAPAGVADAEAGQDTDPIEINGVAHGYVQGMVDLDVVGLTSACNAHIFVRSVLSSGSGDGDLEVGSYAPCIPVDDDGDGVPDLLNPIDVCTSDDQCPGGGICVDGSCLIPQPCVDDGDCDPDERCTAEQICVPVGGGSCSDDSACGDLVCDSGSCVPCSSDEACGDGRICAPDGRCIVGDRTFSLAPGQNVQGGALSCSTSRRGGGGIALGLLLATAGLALGRRKRS